ncbi:MAG: WD40 repeat domain-containing protein [Planctomycetia bacterium]
MGGDSTEVAWCSSGRRLAYNQSGILHIHDFDADTTVKGPSVLLDGEGGNLSWSPDEKHVVFGAVGRIYIVAADMSSNRHLPAHDGIVRCVDVNPNGRQIVSGGVDGTIRSFDFASGAPQWMMIPFADGTSATFSAAGQPLFTEGEAYQHLAYVVEKENGALELLSPVQFLGRVRRALKEAAAGN